MLLPGTSTSIPNQVQCYLTVSSALLVVQLSENSPDLCVFHQAALMAEELKKEQDGSTMMERMKNNMVCTVKGTKHKHMIMVK